MSQDSVSVLDAALTCPMHELHPMHPELLKRPWAMNRRLRDEAPIYQDPQSGIFFVSRYDDVVKMAMDPANFSSVMLKPTRAMGASQDPELVAILKEGYPTVATMLTQDPPLQRRYRKFVDGAFSPSSLKALEPFIENTANALIDDMIKDGECEFLSAFGVPLPLRVIVSQLGAPMSDLHLFRKWTEAFIGNLSQQLDAEGILSLIHI